MDLYRLAIHQEALRARNGRQKSMLALRLSIQQPQDCHYYRALIQYQSGKPIMIPIANIAKK
jgi:hypothetical protein